MAENNEKKPQQLVIEKNIPVRERYPRNAFITVARQMEVGDSIFSTDNRVISAVMTALNKLGRSATTRAEVKDEVQGRRLWRVETRKEPTE